MQQTLLLGSLALGLSGMALAQTAQMGAQTSTFNGSTRGYYFTAPVDFTITGVQVLLQTGSANTFQNFAILKFDGQVPPPPFPTTTNLFTQEALGLDVAQNVFQPVNVSVSTGDVIGVYGNTMASTGLTSGANSYAGIMQQTTMIGGNSVDLFRSGMQFHLGSATSPLGMHDVWTESSFNITRVEFTYVLGGGSLGTSYCGPAVANTSGGPADLTASGSTMVASNDLTLTASGVPANQFGFFLTSQTQGNVPNPGGSNGVLCLGGTIGRYVGAGQIQNAGAGGTFDLALDLTQTPAGAVFVSIAAGQTWNFQAWFRDIGPMGQPQSNFTDGRSITFQ